MWFPRLYPAKELSYVLRDTIQPFPTFSEIYIAALKALHAQITEARKPARQQDTSSTA